MKREKPNHIVIRGVLFLAALISLSSCCEDASLPMVRMDGIIKGAFSLHMEFDASILTETTIRAPGNWADIPAFDPAQLGLSFSGDARWRDGTTSFDVDNDAFDESIRVLQITSNTAADTPVTFFAWQGDRYTLDKNTCYLSFTRGNDTTLLASRCDNPLGVMVCDEMSRDTVCSLCDPSWQCEQCDMNDDLPACLPPPYTPPSTDVDVDVDIDIDIDMDVDVDFSFREVHQ